MMTTGEVLRRANRAGRAAFIGYLPVGFPNVDSSIEAAKVLVDSGADIVELGFPYSDPTMEGRVVQHAMEAALGQGLRRSDVFRAVEETAKTGAAVLVMTYYNPVFVYGVDNFARDLANAGGAGLIIPDLTPEEAGEWTAASDRYGLDRIFMAAPTSTRDRLPLIAGATRGFVYATSRPGVALSPSLIEEGRELVQRVRDAGAEHVCADFGVSTREQAGQLARFADGVVVSSALAAPLVENETDPKAGIAQLAKVASDIAAGLASAAATDSLTETGTK